MSPPIEAVVEEVDAVQVVTAAIRTRRDGGGVGRYLVPRHGGPNGRRRGSWARASAVLADHDPGDTRRDRGRPYFRLAGALLQALHPRRPGSRHRRRSEMNKI